MWRDQRTLGTELGTVNVLTLGWSSSLIRSKLAHLDVVNIIIVCNNSQVLKGKPECEGIEGL